MFPAVVVDVAASVRRGWSGLFVANYNMNNICQSEYNAEPNVRCSNVQGKEVRACLVLFTEKRVQQKRAWTKHKELSYKSLNN